MILLTRSVKSGNMQRMRRLALLLTVLLTPPALASQVSESNCFQYLVSDWSDFTVTSVHIENASHWLRANTGKDFDPDELVRLPDFKRMIQEHREALPDGHIKTLLAKFIYTRWHVWNTANQQSRDAALT